MDAAPSTPEADVIYDLSWGEESGTQLEDAPGS